MGRGQHRAGPDNRRLRELRREDRQYIRWCHERFAELGRQVRSWKVRAEVAEGRLQAKEQQLQVLVGQLMERDSQVDQLQRQLKADAVRTQEIPIVTEAELAAA